MTGPDAGPPLGAGRDPQPEPPDSARQDPPPAPPAPPAPPVPPVPPGSGSRWLPGTDAASSPGQPSTPPAASGPLGDPPRPTGTPAYGGVPPRPAPLPPPRPARPAPSSDQAYRQDSSRPASGVRPVARPRRARLVLKRVDPWSVFLYSVVASVFLGIALVVATTVLYAVLAKLGVTTSLNKLISDVTAEPGARTAPGHFFSFGKTFVLSLLLAAVNVVLLTALATLGAFLYNLCAALTGGIEVTLSDQE